MLILHISVFLKGISFVLHVVSCHIVLYLYNIYTNSNLKFLSYVSINMCICTSPSCLILYNISWVSYGAVFHVSTMHYHVVSCAIPVSHVMYIILIIYLTMFFNFQALFWTHYLHISIHMYVHLPHYTKCKCLVWYSFQCNEMWATLW